MNHDYGQTPLDYLNAISPQQQKPAGFKLSLPKVIIAGVILVVLMLIIVAVIGAAGNSGKTGWQQLSARITVTGTVVTNATPLLKNSQLRSFNSNLKLYLTNTNRDLAKPLAEVGVTGAIPKDITLLESSTGITERLEDARLNAKYDSTYAREMNYQLSTILSLYQQLYTSSKTDATREYLKKSYDDLLPIQQAMATFTASNE